MRIISYFWIFGGKARVGITVIDDWLSDWDVSISVHLIGRFKCLCFHWHGISRQ